MSDNFLKEDILKWTGIIYNPDSALIDDYSLHWETYKGIFIDAIAKGLYENMRRVMMLIAAPSSFNKEFQRLSKNDRKVWYDFASEIPGKLNALNLFIRPFKDFCRTCIITDEEIDKLAGLDQESYFSNQSPPGSKRNKTSNKITSGDPPWLSFTNLPGARKWFFRELNYLIPPQLKMIGYEIIRPEEVAEIDIRMIRKLARAVHSRYLFKMRHPEADSQSNPGISLFQYPGDPGNLYLTEFENLPDEIVSSNLDNAYHIPTKLLSIGFKIRHVQKGYKSVTLHLDSEEIETMAMVEHIRWSWDKRLNGWIYGKIKDNRKKIHPGLLPYNELPESEKEKDRELVRLIPALLQDINYEAYPVNPERIKRLSYAIKPQSTIHKILNETRELNDQLRNMVTLTPVMEEMISIRNHKIEEAINEVKNSYDYAKHIQEAFLPEDLYIRECFPDSFVLYKPKNIVSGDFYFFSKRGDLITFALADCTGHGIPGALISTIGYGSLDQVVNVKKLTDPAIILRNLYNQIHRFLRRNSDEQGMHDDMDITLCILDLRTNILSYAGVGNLIFHLSAGKISTIKSEFYKDDNNLKREYKFTTNRIQMKRGDILYLSSDGYPDQFGGRNHKKYQRKRLMDFLSAINDFPMAEQSDRLNEEIEKWMDENNESQIDDISVIGIRI